MNVFAPPDNAIRLDSEDIWPVDWMYTQVYYFTRRPLWHHQPVMYVLLYLYLTLSTLPNRKKQLPHQMKPSSQRFNSNVEKRSQLDQMSLVLLKKREKKKCPEGGRNVSSPPISSKVQNDQDRSKVAEHKE